MDKKFKMQKSYNYLNSKTSATAITSLIFLVSLPFLILLALPSIIFRDDFVGVWLDNPGDFPFSFSMALFVALCCSTATILTFSDKRDDFCFSAIIIAALIGCILNLIILPINTNSIIIFFYLLTAFLFLSPIILIITLTIDSILTKANSPRNPFKVTSKLIYTDIFIIINLLCSFLLILPISCIYICCTIKNQTKHRSQHLLKKILPLLIVILIPYCIACTTKLTPGLIIPIEYRNYLGFREYNSYYKQAITQLNECKQLKNHIGHIQTQGFAEGRHYQQTDFSAGGEAGRFVLELVGDRGSALVNGCYGDCLGQPEELAVRVYTKSAVKNLTFSQICP
ncbi:hypothetical protein [Nostoc sp.]|uniref:hypothetical protein n=1 Tax=Nostoc sp. TaxID=1180 RepID=UPI002FF90F1D